MKALFSTFAIALLSLFLCAVAPARASSLQEPDKDKQEPDKSKQEPEKKSEDKAKPEEHRPADTEHRQQQPQEEKKPEQPKAEPNRQPEARGGEANNNRQAERGQGQSEKLSQRTGNHNSYRIPDERFHAAFGSGHHFHVHRGDRTFSDGGYSFQFVDPWPAAWSYDDEVYVEFIDGEYYLVDVAHPGVRVLVIVAG